MPITVCWCPSSAAAEQSVEKRYRRLGSFQAEPLLADVLGLQEALEGFGGVQLGQDMAVLFGLEVRVGALDVLLDSTAFAPGP